LKFDEPDLRVLSGLEISKMELENIFSSTNKILSKPELLFKDILDFQQKNEKDFFNFYIDKRKLTIDYPTSKTELLSKLSVRKSRLNSKLKPYNLYIDKQYKINKVNTESLKHIFKSIKNAVKNDIVSLRIFDSYIDSPDTNENIKEKIFSIELLKFLTKILSYNNHIVEIISIFNNENTKNFMKGLLENYSKLNTNSELSLHYVRKPLIQSSSLIYALITDIIGDEYVLYYETATNWFVVIPVKKEVNFSDKFWHLLNSRFSYYIHDEKLQYNNEVLPVTLDIFEINFFDATEELIENLNKLLHTDYKKLTSKKAKELIALEINQSINELKRIKIAFPQTNKGNSILYHHIKLVELVLLLRLDNELFNTREIVEQLFEVNLTKELCSELENEIVKDKFILNMDDIKDINLKTLQKDLIFGEYFNNKSLSDIFDIYQWNTYGQILSSLNKILLNCNDSYKVISTCLSKKSDAQENLFLNIDSKYGKIIFRAILEHFFKINFKKKIHLSLGEIEAIEDVRFKKNKIPLLAKEYYRY